MKKKVFLICSVISLLLVAFPVSVCADETSPNSSSGSEGAVIPFLDSYFYDNYDLLPYIESDGYQYINTGIVPSDTLTTELMFIFSSVSDQTAAEHYFFGSRVAYMDNAYAISNYFTNDINYFHFESTRYAYNYSYIPLSLYKISFSDHVYLNDQLIKTFESSGFDNSNPIYIFALDNNGGSSAYANYRLYKFSMYDSALDANDEPIGYVRYYYPAKAKTSGTIGLYDAVSKTFFPSLGTRPFASPTDDKVLNFQISDFLTSGLTWIGDILDFVIETPILIFFMAIGLAGVAFRWSKRILHF